VGTVVEKELRELWERHASEERAAVKAALDAESWNLTRAALRLGVAYSTLQRVVARHFDLGVERKKVRAA
jgi:transcriptional regulator with GAF, ATPase, and Fis domain